MTKSSLNVQAAKARTEAYILTLSQEIEGGACPMAVVDYAGKRDEFGMITQFSDPRRRYGVRDLRHVKIYDLQVIAYNEAGKRAVHKMLEG